MRLTLTVLILTLTLCNGQLSDESETTSTQIMDLITTTSEPEEDGTTTTLETTTAFPEYEMPTFPSIGEGEDDNDEGPQFVPFGVVLDEEKVSVKKRCRCIEKKRRKVLKEVKYIPLKPEVQLSVGGRKRNFTCKCSHLRKVIRQ